MLAALFAIPAAGLPSDQEQPIRISADQALRDDKQGFTKYKGNVVMDQGSLHIQADNVTVYRIVDEADKIVARGAPAKFNQQPDPNKDPVHAEAEIIEYYKAEDRVQLKGNASIRQEGSTVSGDVIDYFINEQLVKAGSDKKTRDSRVEVVIPASAVQKAGN